MKINIEYRYEHRTRHNRLLKLDSMCFLQFFSLIRCVHIPCAEETITPYLYNLSYYMCINVLECASVFTFRHLAILTVCL